MNRNETVRSVGLAALLHDVGGNLLPCWRQQSGALDIREKIHVAFLQVVDDGTILDSIAIHHSGHLKRTDNRRIKVFFHIQLQLSNKKVKPVIDEVIYG